LAFIQIFTDYLQVVKQATEELKTKVKLSLARCLTTKLEYKMIKLLVANTKAADAKASTASRYLVEYASSAKVDAKEWMFAPLWAEVQKAIAAGVAAK
jgi:putative IMPACT (imprinted ancient) family translation regulator